MFPEKFILGYFSRLEIVTFELKCLIIIYWDFRDEEVVLLHSLYFNY